MNGRVNYKWKKNYFVYGCGAKIQTEHSNEFRLHTAFSFGKRPSHRGEAHCQRMSFRLRHYNEIQDVSLTDDDFFTFIE